MTPTITAHKLIPGQVYKIGWRKFMVWNHDRLSSPVESFAPDDCDGNLYVASDGHLYWAKAVSWPGALTIPPAERFIMFSPWILSDLVLVKDAPVVDGQTYELNGELYDCLFLGGTGWELWLDGSVPDNRRGFWCDDEGNLYPFCVYYPPDEDGDKPVHFYGEHPTASAHQLKEVHIELDLDVWGEVQP